MHRFESTFENNPSILSAFAVLVLWLCFSQGWLKIQHVLVFYINAKL
ncbi:hypothetical protein H4Q32_022252 [Labeo rohita]|uniref:Uncharacterized protein n=1 Tax=Labeo rohita TaxID=84645 RepID=A0ABQ8MA28_LABRO|nr:hypothetical protein H4Q32_022252 [Labeo rohita]